MGALRAWFAAVIGPRVAIAKLTPTGGAGVVTALTALNVVLGVLPIAFLLATSVLIGRVPAAIHAGVGSGEWDALVVAFVVAAAAFVLLQILTPLQAALGELLARRVDGIVYDRLMAASLGSTGIGPLEDQEVLDDLSEATRELLHGFQSPGKACAGLLALVARYLQLLGCAVLIGAVFSWWAAAALVLTT
ncbi:MAG: ABC transporter ATP-binding protein, partial [Actinomycetota bacterium]|nr:ABC transporter ATP-binding protein [Actinomycetota bacterium]